MTGHPLGPVPFGDLTVAVRGVVRIGADCPYCHRPVPVFGAVGKGRSLDTFTPGYFCRGHATRVPNDDSSVRTTTTREARA